MFYMLKNYFILSVSCRFFVLLASCINTLLIPFILGGILGNLKEARELSTSLLLCFAVATVLLYISQMMKDILCSRLQYNLAADQSLKMMKKVIFCNRSELLGSGEENTANRILRDSAIQAESMIIRNIELPAVISTLLLACYSMLFGSSQLFDRMLQQNPQKGNLTLAAIVICMSPLFVLFLLGSRKFSELEHKHAKVNDEQFRTSTEVFRGLKEIQMSNGFDFALERIRQVIGLNRDHRCRVLSISAIFENSRELVWGCIQLAVLIFAAHQISKNEFGFDDFVSFSALCMGFNRHIYKAVNLIVKLQQAKVHCQLNEKLETLPDSFHKHGTARMNNTDGSLELQQVSYGVKDNRILQNISLHIPAGQHVALAGPTGSGKSTLLKIIMQQLDQYKGEIRYCGQNIRNLDFIAYTNQVAYVSQKPFIFSGTLMDNLLLGLQKSIPDDEICQLMDDVDFSTDLLKKALREKAALTIDEPGIPDISLLEYLCSESGMNLRDTTQALEFLRVNYKKSAVISGLKSRTGNSGETLSEGQKVKLSLAKVLLRDPQILLLDEITAPLDVISQKKIISMLNEKYRDRTIISVSHQIMEIEKMQRVIVLESGRVIQDGSYGDLVTQPGWFALLISKKDGIALTAAEKTNIVIGDDERGLLSGLSLSPIFADVPAEQMSALVRRIQIRELSAGDFAVRRNEAGDEMFIILSGAMEVNGKRLLPGTSFGEIALFGETLRTLDVVALESSKLAVLNREDIVQVVAQNPSMLLSITRSLARIAASETARNHIMHKADPPGGLRNMAPPLSSP